MSTQAKAVFLGKALRTAASLDDAEIAAMLLGPFQVERLRVSHMEPLATLAGQYGTPWLDELLRRWFGARRPWARSGEPERTQWLASLPRLCEALHARGGPGTATAHRVLALAWGGLSEAIRHGLESRSPSYRDQWLAGLGAPLAAILTAGAAADAVNLRDDVLAFARQQDDDVTACVMPALRAARKLPAGTRRDGGFDELAASCAARFKNRLACPVRADDYWSIDPPDGCGCELCGTLAGFLRDPVRRTFEWPLAKDNRKHVHFRIDGAELPVRHETRRRGSPYTLVLFKTQALFEREQQARKRDEADLAWLIDQWPLSRESYARVGSG